MARQVVITGNWKMYKTIEEATSFVEELIPQVETVVYLAVPFTAIQPCAKAAEGSNIVIGAQNMNDATEGAFTGEIAACMLKDAGAQFVILGHSERRHIFNEGNVFINRKVKRALADGLQPILCIGETLEEREAGQTQEVLKTQLVESLEEVSSEALENMLIAYEPVWAIGTDETATPEAAQEAHAFCRAFLAENWSQEAADKVRIQYGGSVRPENAKSLVEMPDVDGLLVGGASLTLDFFVKIVNYNKS